MLAWWNNIPVDVTSAYRSAERQRQLQIRWDQGDRVGLKVRPATDSRHSNTDNFGNPDSLAIDLNSDSKENLRNLGYLATNYCGLKWGGNFLSPDPVHFYV